MRFNSFKRTFDKIYSADFETTTNVDDCFAWSCALCRVAEKISEKDVDIYPTIGDFMQRLFAENGNILVYFHNLKFDGTFILEYMYRETNFICCTNDQQRGVQVKDLKARQYQYSISDKGQWYTIQIRTRSALIEIRDSLKILPFSLDKLCKFFDIEHKKTTMDYNDKASLFDCSEQDITYIKNDVLGLAECLHIFIERYGATKNTIGSNCLEQYKKIVKSNKNLLTKDIFVAHEKQQVYPLNRAIFGCNDVEQFIRKSYKGGFCYCNPKYQNKIVGAGYVLDVNSLYPAVMELNDYPIGPAYQFIGAIDDHTEKYRYYFVQIKVNDCYLKKGKLPCVQIKRDLRFKANEWLSKIAVSEPVTLVLTKTDFKLFCENYNIGYLQFDGGVSFELSTNNIFADYVDIFRDAKENATNLADRTIAKLFLNNCYGKLSSRRDCDYKIVVHNATGWQYQTIQTAKKKKSINIAIGSAITSYARDYIIRSAQHNIKNFCYADTDSLHCVGNISDIEQFIQIDSKKFGAFKLENTFDKAKFVRQKTYAEIDKSNISITGCGMGEKAKALMAEKIAQGGLDEFRHGVVLPKSKLLIKPVKGGTVLVDTDFTLR